MFREDTFAKLLQYVKVMPTPADDELRQKK